MLLKGGLLILERLRASFLPFYLGHSPSTESDTVATKTLLKSDGEGIERDREREKAVLRVIKGRGEEGCSVPPVQCAPSLPPHCSLSPSLSLCVCVLSQGRALCYSKYGEYGQRAGQGSTHSGSRFLSGFTTFGVFTCKIKPNIKKRRGEEGEREQ